MSSHGHQPSTYNEKYTDCGCRLNISFKILMKNLINSFAPSHGIQLRHGTVARAVESRWWYEEQYYTSYHLHTEWNNACWDIHEREKPQYRMCNNIREDTLRVNDYLFLLEASSGIPRTHIRSYKTLGRLVCVLLSWITFQAHFNSQQQIEITIPLRTLFEAHSLPAARPSENAGQMRCINIVAGRLVLSNQR